LHAPGAAPPPPLGSRTSRLVPHVLARDPPPADGPDWAVPSKCREPLLIAGLFSGFLNLLGLTLPLFTMQVYDRVLPSSSVPTLLVLTGLAVALVVALAALEMVRAWVMIRAANRIDAGWRDHLLDLTARGSAGIGAMRDLDTVRGFVGSPLAAALLDAPWSIVFLLVITLLHPLLGMLAAIGAVLLLALAVAGNRATTGLLTAAQREAAEVAALLDGCVASREAMVGGGPGRRLLDHIAVRRARGLSRRSTALDRAAAFAAVGHGIRFGLQIALLAVAAFLALEGRVAAGAIVAASMLMARALAPIERVAAGWGSCAEALKAHRRLAAALTVRPGSLARTSLPRPRGALEVTKLVAWPLGRAMPTLQDVTFALRPGEMLCVLGPCGAGKSSLAGLLAGTAAPHAGTVRLDGAELRAWNEEELVRHLGYLPQELAFVDGTIAESIARFGRVEDALVIAAAQVAGAHEAVLRLPEAYETRLGLSRPVLSRGELQRIGLARTLYGRPALVVLDEPTFHLDEQGEKTLVAAVRALKSRGTTVVVVSRCIALLHLADHLLMLNQGRLHLFRPRSEVEAMLAPRLAAARASQPRVGSGG
jgi:ATP-binding cassette subfamily C exporter for protease/lipase